MLSSSVLLSRWISPAQQRARCSSSAEIGGVVTVAWYRSSRNKRIIRCPFQQQQYSQPFCSSVGDPPPFEIRSFGIGSKTTRTISRKSRICHGSPTALLLRGEYCNAVPATENENHHRHWFSSSSSSTKRPEQQQQDGGNGGTTTVSGNGYVQNWIHLKDQLLNAPMGSWNHRHYNEAQELLKDLRSNSLGQVELEHVQSGFDLLDRLLQEKTQQQQQQQQATHSSSSSSFRQVENLTVWAVLAAWRDAILRPPTEKSNHHNSESTATTTSQRQRPQHPTTAAPVLQLLSPDEVFDKLTHYTDHGLFIPHVEEFNILLHAMSKLPPNNNNNTTKLRPEKIFQRLLKLSHRNPHNTSIHPNKRTIENMVTSCSSRGAGASHHNNKEPHVQAEKYLSMLLKWYAETNHMPCYRPTPGLYCTIMNLHSSFNTNTEQALGRILELFQDMKQTLRQRQLLLLSKQGVVVEDNNNYDDKADPTICYTRALKALANLRRVEEQKNVHAARAILDEMCESVGWMETTKRSNRYDHNLQQEQQQQLLLEVRPDHMAFGAVLTAYSRAGMASEAQELFDYMEQKAELTGDPLLRPTTISFSTLIWAHAKVGDTEKAEAVMVRLMEGAQNDTKDRLDQQLWSGLLTSWAESGEPDSAQRIKLIMEGLRKVVQEQGMSENVINNTTTYNILLSSYSRQKKNPLEAAREAEKLFRWMDEHPDRKVRPNGPTYFSMCLVWGNAGAPEQSELYLRELYAKIMQGKLKREALEARHFNVVIQAWANKRSFAKAQAVFNRMKEVGVPPDYFTYNALLNAARHSDDVEPKESAELVMRLFNEMYEQWYNGGDGAVKPNKVTYNTVISCLTRSPLPKAVELTEQVFAKMKLDSAWKPDPGLIRTIMQMYKNANQPTRVEEMFQLLVAEQKRTGVILLDSDHFQKRLFAWSRAGEPERATKALQDWMQASTSTTQSPWLKQKPEGAEFTSVLRAWARSDRTLAWQKAERGLFQMIRLSQEGKFDCTPDVISFTTVISAYLKSPTLTDHCERATKLLMQLKTLADQNPNHKKLELTGDALSFILALWYKNGVSANSLEVFYQKMKENFPNACSYGTVHLQRMKTWNREKNIEMALLALNDWISDTENSDRKPNLGDFNVALREVAFSNLDDPGETAENLLRRMFDWATRKEWLDHCHPNAESYQWVILAHARSNNTKDAGKKTLQLFHELKEISQKKPGPLMNHSLSSYAAVVKALVQSEDDAPLKKKHVPKLFDELRRKPPSFWRDEYTLHILDNLEQDIGELYQQDVQQLKELANSAMRD